MSCALASWIVRKTINRVHVRSSQGSIRPLIELAKSSVVVDTYRRQERATLRSRREHRPATKATKNERKFATESRRESVKVGCKRGQRIGSSRNSSLRLVKQTTWPFTHRLRRRGSSKMCETFCLKFRRQLRGVALWWGAKSSAVPSHVPIPHRRLQGRRNRQYCD